MSKGISESVRKDISTRSDWARSMGRGCHRGSRGKKVHTKFLVFFEKKIKIRLMLNIDRECMF